MENDSITSYWGDRDEYGKVDKGQRENASKAIERTLIKEKSVRHWGTNGSQLFQ